MLNSVPAFFRLSRVYVNKSQWRAKLEAAVHYGAKQGILRLAVVA